MTATVTFTPGMVNILQLVHGDSNAAQNCYVLNPPPHDDRAMQHVTATAASRGYDTLTPGLTTNTTPFETQVENLGNGRCGAVHFEVAELLDGPFAGNPNVRIISKINGFNGASVAFTGGHNLGPLPDSGTAIGIANMQACIDDVVAAYPGATLKPIIIIHACINDAGHGVDPMAIYDAIFALIPDLRSAFEPYGFTGDQVPVVVISIPPEYNDVVGSTGVDQAERTATLATSNAYWVQIPPGIGSQHLGETVPPEGYEASTGNPTEQYGIERAGREFLARIVSIALRLIAAADPVFDIADNFEVEEGSADTLQLLADQKVLWSVHPGYEAAAEVSHPVTGTNTQTVGPAGGTHPAYTGTGADTIEYKLDWKSAEGKAGTLTRHWVVTEVSDTVYNLYDTTIRADTSISATGAGTTSGAVNETGAGIQWRGNAQIAANKIVPASVAYTCVLGDAGTAYGRFSADLTIPSAGKPVFVCAALWNGSTTDAWLLEPGYLAIDIGLGRAGYSDAGGIFREMVTFTSPGPGTHNFAIEVMKPADDILVEFFINGVSLGAAAAAPPGTTIDDTHEWMGFFAGTTPAGVDFTNAIAAPL